MGKKLDISSLIKAYEFFSNALKTADIYESRFSKEIFYTEELVRAGVIQHFEYTYELSWKMMKRFMEIDEGRLKGFTNRALLRRAGELELIDDFHKWREFHEARNLTSHTYDEETAEKVYAAAKEFDVYVEKLISNLKEKIKDL
jgi:nucleotidyltransferase substrate binding protein (TIGR01987 family)